MNNIRTIRPMVDDVRTEDEIRAGVVHTEPADMPTDEQILDALVVNNGVMPRVAASMNITETYIINVACKNVRALSKKLRARLMLSSFGTMLKIDAALQVNIDEMPADAIGRTYAATLASFTNLAGQFEEQEEPTDTDDAGTAKLTLLDRLETMGKRERTEEIERAATADGAS